MIDRLDVKFFVEDWKVGCRLLLYVAVLGGLCLVAGAIAGGLFFGVFIGLPAVVLLHAELPSVYYQYAAALGAATQGVAMIGKWKAAFLEAINGENKARNADGS